MPGCTSCTRCVLARGTTSLIPRGGVTTAFTRILPVRGPIAAVRARCGPMTGLPGRGQGRLVQGSSLLAQGQDVVLPVALGVEPGEGGRERRVVPAQRQPAGIVDHA